MQVKELINTHRTCFRDSLKVGEYEYKDRLWLSQVKHPNRTKQYNIPVKQYTGINLAIN